jgi:DNA mismatch repair ATPase MutS
LYALAVEAIEKQRGQYLGVLARYPDSVLRHGIDSMTIFLEFLKRLRGIADLHGGKFTSDGWGAFFAMLKENLDEGYFSLVQAHLETLKLRNGELLSARLGRANKAGDYVLHRVPDRGWSLAALWTDIFVEKADAYSFELHPRDEAGAQALGTIRNRGIALAANALGRSADHIRDFFSVLRIELAFYVGCINLHEHLTRKGEPVCMPSAVATEEQGLSFDGLYDVGLALSIGDRTVGNDANADGRTLIVVTGPNTGGKSTFLRSLGLAQLMMQSGMFVAAEMFRASLCDGLFTHYKREEDTSMKSGKFDEELGRMSDIVDHIGPSSMLLLNESFASTNEREGSEIARQIISALTEKGVRVFCVTHLYELARGFYERNRGNELFLRAERHVDGTRTFKLAEGAPLPTSFGEDLYERIFASRKPPEPIEERRAQL